MGIHSLGIGYGRACMVDIHVQVEISMADGDTFSGDRLWPSMHGGYPCTGRDMYVRWEYILLDRLSLSMHGGYPCTGRDKYGRWGYILWG